MQRALLNYPNLDVRAGSVFDLAFSHTTPQPCASSSGQNIWATVDGIRLGCLSRATCVSAFDTDSSTDTGELIKCTQVVLCTGTFLSGEIHIGTLTYCLCNRSYRMYIYARC